MHGPFRSYSQKPGPYDFVNRLVGTVGAELRRMFCYCLRMDKGSATRRNSLLSSMNVKLQTNSTFRQWGLNPGPRDMMLVEPKLRSLRDLTVSIYLGCVWCVSCKTFTKNLYSPIPEVLPADLETV